MNRSTKNSFVSIQGAAATFQKNVVDALKKFETDQAKAVEESRQYKDEEQRLSAMTAALKANARNTITRAEQAFTGTVKTELDSLRSELASHLLTAPSPQLISTLALYRDFGITPSKAETNALVTMAGGNVLSLRCIDSLLKSTKAGYTVVFPSSEALEADLDKIEKLTHGHFRYSPTELHHAAVEVYGGLPVIYTRPDGTTYEDGSKMDNARVVTSREAFESTIKALDSMSERWTDNVIPSVQQLKTDLYPAGEKGKEAFAEDRRSTAEAAQIEKETVIPDVTMPSGKNYAEIMNYYRR